MKMNRKGFTLMELMVSVGLLGIVSLGVLQLMRMQSTLQINSQIDGDFAVLNTQIVSVLAAPQNCNANFYGRTTTSTYANNLGNTAGATQGIYECSSGTGCKPNTIILKWPAQSASWDQATTKVSDRVRITAVQYMVNSTSSTALSSLQLKVTMQSKRVKAGGNGQADIKTVDKVYSVPVVVSGTSILGCPKASNTTVLY